MKVCEIYYKNDIFHVICNYITVTNQYIACDPKFKIRNGESSIVLGKAILQAINASQDGFPFLKNLDDVNKQLLHFAGFKSWRAFIKGAMYFFVINEETGIEILPSKHCSGGFEFLSAEHNIKCRLDPEEVGIALLQLAGIKPNMNTDQKISVNMQETNIESNLEKERETLNARKNDSDIQAEAPISFGYKCSWLALKTNDVQKIINVLNLKNIKEANWSSGLEVAYDTNGEVFVSPSLGEWTLVIGLSLPTSGDSEHSDELTPLLLMLSKQFDEVQYFGTHRVVEYHAWAKARLGGIVRAYSYLGETGEIIWNKGEITKEEKELGFNFVDENSLYGETDDKDYPDEESVLAIAKKWSMDTSFEDEVYEPGIGYIGSLKV